MRGRLSLAVVVVAALAIILDLSRPYAGPSLRPWQWGIGVLGLVVGYAWLRSRGLRSREAVPFVALAALLLPTWIDHSRGIASDGIHYYTYLRSLLLDGDLDLANDYVLLGSDYGSPNVLPVGAPILWSPLLLLVHGARLLARVFGAGPATGVEPLYQAAVCLATLAYGSAGLLLLFDTLKRWVSPTAAFWTSVVCWVGSPLRFYLAVLPSMAHGVEFFAAVLVLRAYLALRQKPGPARAAWAGAACGLAFLTRSQDAILLAAPAIELGLRALTGRVAVRASLTALGALLGGFLAAALPQLVVWQAMFGVPVLVPHKALHGAAFMRLTEPQLVGTLLSPRGGLFVTHPALLLALFGLVWLLVRPLRARDGVGFALDGRYLVAVVPVLLIGWYVNSTVFDWYQVRRFTGLVPFLAPGLAVVLAPLARAGHLPLAILALLFFRYDLAVDYLRPQPGRPVAVQAALSELADGLAADTYRLAEPRVPRAAATLLASYTGEALLSDEVSRIDIAGGSPLLRLPEPARHLSGPSVEDGEACRWVEDIDTRFFLPLSWDGGVIVSVRARALETTRPQFIEGTWNEHGVGRHPMSPRWQVYRFRVPAEAVTPGTNVLVLRFERAPIYRRTRGEGPRRVRPAALSELILHRNQ